MDKKLGTLIYSMDRVSMDERKALDPHFEFGIDMINVKQNKNISY
jgi:hypothetical protein